VQIGLILLVVIGMSALGVEISYALYKHRQQQSAADSSALAGATALAIGHPTDPATEARAVAGSAGYVDGTAGVTVTVNHPPASGSYAGNQIAVEVIISQPQTLSMMGLFRTAAVSITARAVAIERNSGLYCVLALDTSAAQSILLNNNAVVSNPNCGVASNSSSATALTLDNNAQVNGPVSVRGNWSLGNNAELNGHPLISNGPTISDPYANVQLQSVPACTSQSGTAGNNATVSLNPGHFCSGWSFSNNVTLNLSPGTYYIDQQLTFGNNTTMNGTGGVTLVINGNYAISIGNNAEISLTAPTSGPYAGLAFFGLPTASPTVTQTFSNNTELNIKGAVYFPNQIIQFDNNGTTAPSGCTQVIARIVRFSNNVQLDNSCNGTGTKPIANPPSQLVE